MSKGPAGESIDRILLDSLANCAEASEWIKLVLIFGPLGPSA